MMPERGGPLGERDSEGEMRNADPQLDAGSRRRLATIVDAIVTSRREAVIDGEDDAPFPSRRQVVEIVGHLLELLLPGRPVDHELVDSDSLEQEVRRRVSLLVEMLSLQISVSLRHGCMNGGRPCEECRKLGQEQAIAWGEGPLSWTADQVILQRFCDAHEGEFVHG